MDDSLQNYRAAIGSFYFRCEVAPLLRRYSTYFTFPISGFIFRLYWRYGGSHLSVNVFVFLFVILWLLSLQTDIEWNPGPNRSITSDQSEHLCGLSVFHLNTRSIRNKIDDLSDLLEGTNVICFTETHLDNTVSQDSIAFDGYYVPFRKDFNNRSGGILIYCMSDLYVKRRNDLELNIDECIWVEIILKNKRYLLCTLYRQRDLTLNFWNALETSVSRALEETDYVILNGDWNVDFLTPLPSVLNDILNLYGLRNVIREPTRFGLTRNSLLDPVIVSNCIETIDDGVIPIERQISDHDGTFVIINSPLLSSSSFHREIWLYNRGNYELFKQKINSTDWNDLIQNSENIDMAAELFTHTLITAAKSSIPVKLVEIRQNDKPWFTSNLRTAIRVRERLRKIAVRTRDIRDQQKYKTQRNKVTNMKKVAKALYFEKINDNIHETKTNNPRTYWRIMKSFMNKNDVGVVIPPLNYKENGIDKLACSDEEKCNVLNDYFCSITSLEGNDQPLPHFPNRCESVLNTIQITSEEIEKIITTLPLNKASGPDKINHKLLKPIAKEIAYPLKILFEKSLTENKFPKIWKEALVIPIYKKADRNLPENYRPISLLSCIGKLFERIIFQHTLDYLVENKLLYDYQSGFIPGHSTVHQLIEIYDNICRSLENKDLNCITFCDVSKAFDRVWHRGLLLKLEGYGIIGNLLSWFSSYIDNRSQKVCYRNSSSSSQFTYAGVPQGSVLGPLLFLIYINDIADDIQGLTRLFADDTSVGNISPDLDTVIRNTNCDLSKINTWAKSWLIKFNPMKTDIEIFTNKTIETINNNFEFDNQKLIHVDHHKHLGVTFQSNGKWSSHIDNIINKASKQINVLRKVKYQLKRENVSKLYTVFIRPILEYASEVWCNCSEYDSNRLERVQLEAARIVTGLPIYASKASLYFETGWETLESRRKRKCLCQLFNIVNHKSP